jgi:low temperature requirement protein LtrA
MSEPSLPSRHREGEEPREARVAPIELFFDLVFVFALTQVTAFLAQDLTWTGLGRGMMLLAALWWAWICYAWLTDAVPPEVELPARLVLLSAMAAMILASLAVPRAFAEAGLLFGGAYLAVRVLHVALYALVTRGTPEAQRAVLRLAPGFLISSVLLVAAGLAEDPLRTALWLLALLMDYAAPLVSGVAGLRVKAAHFVERHGLFVIVALGESIVAIGAAGVPQDRAVLVAAVLGVAVAGGLWWAYFDVVALAAEHQLVMLHGHERTLHARDSYTYLHFPMVAGIVLVALGIKKTLAHVDLALEAIPAMALCGGAALYLLGHVGFRLRDLGTVNVPRLLLALVCCALVPIAMRVPAVATLATLAALLAVLGAIETYQYREVRRTLGRP